jgi:hypothetical protein
MINYTLYNITYDKEYKNSDILYMFILFIGYGLICFIIIKCAFLIEEYINNNLNINNINI